MKKYLLLLVLMFTCITSYGQFTAITGTVTDSDTTVWINASVTVQFQVNPQAPNINQYSIGGVPITSPTYSQYLSQTSAADGSGLISLTLLDNQLISPAGSTWKFVIKPQANVQATSFPNISVTGSSQVLSSFFNSLVLAPRLPAIPGAYGYADIEIFPIPEPGGLYFNTTTTVQRIWNGASWQNGASSGATIPATTLVLCGTGSAGASKACTAGLDYVLPSGTVAKATAFASAPSGCTVGSFSNTQDASGNYTNCVPITNFSGTLPSGTGQVKVTNGIGALSIPWTDFFAALPQTNYGLVPVSTGSGNAYADQAALLQFGAVSDSFLQQPNTPFFFTSFKPNSMGKEFYADGFSVGPYTGVGQATIAWSNTVDAPLCQSVSSGGNFYVALTQTNNHTITPGTNPQYWWKVPQTGATTPLDCAWDVAESYKATFHVNAKVKTGAAIYQTNGLVDFIDGDSFDDEFAVSLEGCGDRCSYIQYSGTSAIPMINRPSGAGNIASMTVRGVTLDGNGVASADIEVSSCGQCYFENFDFGDVAPGSDHAIEFGRSAGDGFQIFATNLNAGVFPDSSVNNCGIFTATPSGSTIDIGITDGGTCYNASYTGLTVVKLLGTQGGTATTPCSTMPTGGGVATITGTAVTAVTSFTGASGCSGTIYVQVYQTPNVDYGIIYNASDSTGKDLVGFLGSQAFLYTIGGNTKFFHIHPEIIENGIVSSFGAAAFYGTELDGIGGYGFQIINPLSGLGVLIDGTSNFNGAGAPNRLLVGSATYYIGSATAAVSPIMITGSHGLCEDTNGGGAAPPGWNEFLTQSGPIVNPADYFTKTPAGLSVVANDTSCGQAMGDYLPALSSASVILAGVTPSTDPVCPHGTNGALITSGCTAGGSPGGSDTQVQFNNSGAFGGNSGLTFNFSTGLLTPTAISTGTIDFATLGSAANFTINNYLLFNTGVQFFEGGANYDSVLNMDSQGTATTGSNQSSWDQVFGASYCTGSPCAAASTNVKVQLIPGTGINPLVSFDFVASTPAAGGNNANFHFPVEATVFEPNSAQTVVNCSTSGTVTFSQPEAGASDKKVVMHLDACLGTASYTYPTAFIFTPSVFASNNVAATIATSVSSTAVTLTGTTSTGALIIEDF